MTEARNVRSRSRRLLLLMLVIIAPPSLMLLWLGWRLSESDRALLEKQAFDAGRAAGHAAVQSLEQALTQAENWASHGPIPDGMVRFRFTSLGLSAHPAAAVRWLPTPPPLPADDGRAFVEAEALEFQEAGGRALIRYKELARSKVSTVRAGALLRIARVHRREKRWEEALSAYRELGAIPNVAIHDTPGDLVARRAFCATLQEAGRTADLKKEAAALTSDLLVGRWVLDRIAWDLTAGELAQWQGQPPAVDTERHAFSVVAEQLWRERQNQASPGALHGRRVIRAGDTAVTVLAREQGASSEVLAISPRVIEEWTRTLAARVGSHRVTLLGGSGLVVAGLPPAEDASTLTWPASDTGLPWTLAVAPGDSSTLISDLAARRRLLSLGLVTILLLLGSGSYFLWRVVQRELAVARLQTEFVAAVSHEFRTPLTSLRHVTDLLEESDELPPERRRAFYGALGRNTDRLQRLVESLLDFARMEGGKKPYHLRTLEAGALVRHIVEEFQKDAEPRGFSVMLDVDPATPFMVRADPDALAHAAWNLLDNAVKYSPGGSLVRVSVQHQHSAVVISVQDHGLGVPRGEQREIFGRFVRGAKATEHCITGTGLGLAMALQIVQAHGGEIHLQSEEGAGSTFSIVLPAAENPEPFRAVVRRTSDSAPASSREPHNARS